MLRRFSSHVALIMLLSPSPCPNDYCVASSIPGQPRPHSLTGKSYISVLRSMNISFGRPNLREKSLLTRLRKLQARIGTRMLKGSSPSIRLPTSAQIPQNPMLTGKLLKPCKIVLWAVASTAYRRCLPWGFVTRVSSIL